MSATNRGYSQFGEDTLPLPTKHLTSGEVLKFRDKAFDEYYSSEAYLTMIEKKFGPKTVEHIKKMCSVKLRRKYYDADEEIHFHRSE